MGKEVIAVLGAGSWGTALAHVAAENGHDVRLWTYKPTQVNEINELHRNHQYLGDNPIHPAVVATADMQTAVRGATMVLTVVPTKATRQVARQLAAVLVALDQQVTLVAATKGIEANTYKRPSEMLAEEIPQANRLGIGIIAGPSHAEGVIKHDPTLVTMAAEDLQIAKQMQAAFSNQFFRAYTNTDLVGSEFGGALKNVIAIGAGAIEALGFDANAKAALFTRGLAEMSRLGQAFGANPLTFMGLAGVGDLFVTATSVHSRNFRAGLELGKNKSVDEVVSEMGMVIEGISTTKVVHELGRLKHVPMPITDAIYSVLYEGKNTKEVVTALMERELQQEGN
ncbi:NAD(P)H-dependent glycerol-3-phosphate dehydrogenase [Weissella oryzae]|uniref:NAD(P)H-dependent glycerol-3-phosphate dehydrogenase n=1 Tax=Weissella oryzae TaxID=1129792 RepID=UPI000484EA20|nr:NAD(P)H-dependent glycerol-3-phosphate dehydrogenase [Weissella oryzae]